MYFFRRLVCDEVVVRMRLFVALSIIWAPIILISIFGLLNFGLSFFTLSHWIDYIGGRYNPYIAITICLTMVFVVIFVTIDDLLAYPYFICRKDKLLVINRRKTYHIDQLNLDEIFISGLFGNIINIRMKNSSHIINIPLVKCRGNEAEIVNALKSLGSDIK